MMLSIKRSPGFTLIELMITVAILAIIAAIAIPNYSKYSMRGKRAEGRAALLNEAALQERNYSNNRQYTSTVLSGDPPTCTVAGTQSESCNYTLSVVASGTGNQDFDATATPSGWTDDECGALGLDETGTKTESGTSDVAYCWGK